MMIPETFNYKKKIAIIHFPNNNNNNNSNNNKLKILKILLNYLQWFMIYKQGLKS